MRIFSLFLFTSISAACFAQSTAPAATGAPSFVQKCSNQFNSTTGRTELVCTSDTSAPIAALKTQSNAMASGTGNMLGTGATTGEYTADLSTCDAEGNCTSAGTGTFSLDSIIGQGDSTGQSDVSEGVEAEITMHNTLDFTCGSTRTHFLGSGIAVKISNCALDASKNVQSFEVSICRKMLQEGGCMRAELNSDSDSSNDVPPEGLDDWSTPVIFTKTTMAFVNNYTRTIDPDATATGSCYSASSRCALDFTVNVNISGDLTELADQAAGTSGNDDLYMSGHNFAQRQADKPSWDAQFMEPGTGDFNAKSMMDCAENSLIGSADQGFLLSCDGTQQVNIASTTCNEVATCVQTETTVISYMTACESFVPISSQTCHVQMPYGSCEVFLESHEQTCDTITPHGTCVYELESVIQTCDIHIPNGHCNEELVMDDMACVYSVPEGSCNVELLSSIETCTNTIPQGTCNVELNTFTKTCQEDVSRLEECLITTETTESDCFAKPRYTIHECESVKDVQEYECKEEYVLTSTGIGNPLGDEEREVDGSAIPGGGRATAKIGDSSFSCKFFVPTSSGGGGGGWGGGGSSSYTFSYNVYKDGVKMGSGFNTWSMNNQTSSMTVTASPGPDESGAEWKITCQVQQAHYASTATITYKPEGGGASVELVDTCESQGLE